MKTPARTNRNGRTGDLAVLTPRLQDFAPERSRCSKPAATRSVICAKVVTSGSWWRTAQMRDRIRSKLDWANWLGLWRECIGMSQKERSSRPGYRVPIFPNSGQEAPQLVMPRDFFLLPGRVDRPMSLPQSCLEASVPGRYRKLGTCGGRDAVWQQRLPHKSQLRKGLSVMMIIA
jgi:hypothetical protein